MGASVAFWVGGGVVASVVACVVVCSPFCLIAVIPTAVPQIRATAITAQMQIATVFVPFAFGGFAGAGAGAGATGGTLGVKTGPDVGADACLMFLPQLLQTLVLLSP